MLKNYRKGYREARAAGRAKTAVRLEKKAAKNASIDGDLIIECTTEQMKALSEAGWEVKEAITTGIASTRYIMRRAAVDRVAQV